MIRLEWSDIDLSKRRLCVARSDWRGHGRQTLGQRKPGLHILRHTFCSHLAMRGAPARAIQELAGHQDLGTQRYMHLSPAALDAAIRRRSYRATADKGEAMRVGESEGRSPDV